jgi:hypothetical protein
LEKVRELLLVTLINQRRLSGKKNKQNLLHRVREDI